ncbi:hypothetical protein C4J97_0136 [Pseudomonas orientalis]|nr:hypothetical protein C4J97_0136 [Pseudomonas orientalis]
MLAKNVNDNACFLNERGACGFFASKLAPTLGLAPLRSWIAPDALITCQQVTFCHAFA